MINLLPASAKQQLKASRTNVILINYLLLIGFAVFFLVAACFVSYLFLADTKTTAENLIKNNQSTIIANPSSPYDSNLMNTEFTNAKNIINQQVLYSDIIMDIGNILPEGVVIDSLSLSNNSIGTPITIKAHAKTYDNTAALKTNLQNSSQFLNFNMGTQTMNQAGLSDYPVEFSFMITVNRSNL